MAILRARGTLDPAGTSGVRNRASVSETMGLGHVIAWPPRAARPGSGRAARPPYLLEASFLTSASSGLAAGLVTVLRTRISVGVRSFFP